ncbi:MAG TPA: MMPL family transporter [Actinocrinis sp.]|jgi:RND superfamily putative drug exporter|uniref:MMPL family transporter n=1 Tax=Actinocrinis sp. TaxID=1920516 RepID=UPI002DDDAB32|nr:MMPL family transporter [Actinocrinis sp.]HEV3173381.1 MMPL family transporter [Actinocrinis sp.]
MSGFFAAAGRFAVRFRWAVIAAWVVATVLANLYLPSLNSVAKGSNSDYLPPGSPSRQAAQLAVPFQSPNQAAIPVLVARDGGALTAADRAAIVRLDSGLDRVANVQKVNDLGVSRDGRVDESQVLATLDLSTLGPLEDLDNGLRAEIRSAGLPGDLTAHLAGPLAAQADAAQSSQQAGNVGEDLSILFILVLLFVVFRSILAPLLTLAPAVLVTQLAGPVIGAAGKAGLPVSSLTGILLIVLALGAGTDYGLFLVFRVREELRDGVSPRDAVVRALSRVGESITFSAVTVIAALLTLLLASLGLYSSLGAPLAIAVALMLLAGLTLMPALLAVFGRAAFWPSKTTRSARRPGWWGRTAGRIVRRPATTLVLGLLGFGALAIAAIAYVPGGFGSGPAAPTGSDSAAGNALLAAHFPTASRNPTGVLLRFPDSVWTDPAPVARAQRLLAASPQFNSVVGPFDSGQVTLAADQLTSLHATLGDPAALPAVPPPGSGVQDAEWAAYRAESQFISPDGRTVQFEVGLTAGAADSNAAAHQIPAIRAAVAAFAREAGATANGVTGQAASVYDVGQTSDGDLLRIFPVAVLAIAILLALVLRSLIAPLYLIASVAVSYLAAFGLSVLLFQHANGGSLPYFVPFLMFLFLLALGEDYNILVMTRIREEAGDIPLREAVPHALEHTGSTISSAGLVLAGTFGVFAFVENGQPGGGVYRDILASLAIGILMDAFLVRTLLVPATVALLGRWNWWPSAHGRPVEAERSPAPTPTAVR